MLFTALLPKERRMSKPKAKEKPELSLVRPPGRVRSALRVLRGEALVPDQIRAEWIEYQVTFSGLLERFGALLARQAKSQKKSLDEQLAEAPPVPAPTGNRKQDLRTRAAHIHLSHTLSPIGVARAGARGDLGAALPRSEEAP